MSTRRDEPHTAQSPRNAMTRRRFGAVAATAMAGAVGAGLIGGRSTSTNGAASAASPARAARGRSKRSKAGTKRAIVKTAAAATAFVKTLSAEQREQLLYGFTDETKTTSWSNFPVTFVARAGLNLTTDLDDTQRAAAMKVLAALLGDEGYETVTGIINGDVFLHEKSSSTESSLGQYYIAFFGKPSASRPWEVQFGGHHLGINATLDGGERAITFAPTHLGSQPAVYTADDGSTVQPLAGMYKDAFRFFNSLSSEQRTAGFQGDSVAAMVCAPGSTCSFPTGSGLAGSDLSAKQRKLLLKVIANWVGLADEQTTKRALKRIEAGLNRTYVKWSGATTYDMSSGEGIYYEISGPKVFIEFASQQGSAGADVDGYVTAGWGHIHTIYRDPTNDYAGSVTQQAASGMGGGTAPGGTPPTP
ncbi:MAG: DUF3500 domain-containing protein [Solirubrobacterales bacterium]